MMKRYARSIDGVVVELFATDGDIADYFPPEFGFVEAPIEVRQGWLFDGRKHTPPPIKNQPSAPSVSDLMARAKAELRTMRAPMLDALAGIAGRAARAGNDAMAAEADSLAEQLLDITDDVALNAATTYEAMQATGVDAYRRLAAAASPELASVFREITGA